MAFDMCPEQISHARLQSYSKVLWLLCKCIPLLPSPHFCHCRNARLSLWIICEPSSGVSYVSCFKNYNMGRLYPLYIHIATLLDVLVHSYLGNHAVPAWLFLYCWDCVKCTGCNKPPLQNLAQVAYWEPSNQGSTSSWAEMCFCKLLYKQIRLVNRLVQIRDWLRINCREKRKWPKKKLLQVIFSHCYRNPHCPSTILY